jgi:tetratricopeptide (TPR) repeat protein
LPQLQADLTLLHNLDLTLLDRTEPELEYLFKHVITHEVTYESLSFATRARLHEQLATYVEAQIALGHLSETALLDTLVYHYGHTPNLAKRRLYGQKAVAAAQAISAFATAVNYLTQLLEITPPDDPAHFALAFELAETYHRLGDHTAAQSTLAQLPPTTTNIPTNQILLLALLGEIAGDTGNYEEAHNLLTQAIFWAHPQNNTALLCRLLTLLGIVYNRLGQLTEAHAVLQEGLLLAEQLGDLNRKLHILHGLSWVAFQQDDLAEAERLVQQIYEQAAAVGNRERMMSALNSLGIVANQRGEFALRQERIRAALALAQEIGSKRGIAQSLVNLADGEVRLGHLADGRRLAQEALGLALRLEARPWVIQSLITFARLAYAEGETEQALALWGLAQSQPAFMHEHQLDLAQTLRLWGIDPAVAQAGLAAGAELDWQKSIQALLHPTTSASIHEPEQP